MPTNVKYSQKYFKKSLSLMKSTQSNLFTTELLVSFQFLAGLPFNFWKMLIQNENIEQENGPYSIIEKGPHAFQQNRVIFEAKIGSFSRPSIHEVPAVETQQPQGTILT